MESNDTTSTEVEGHERPICTVPAKVLKGLLLAAGNKDARRYLNGVQFETMSGTLIASDGQVFLLVDQDFSRICRPFTLSRAACERAIELASEELPGIAVNLSESGADGLRQVTLAGALGSIIEREMEDDCDDRAISNASKNPSIPLMTDQIARLRNAMRIITGDENLMVQSMRSMPILIVCRDSSVLGMVMPCTPQEDVSLWHEAVRALESASAGEATTAQARKDGEE